MVDRQFPIMIGYRGTKGPCPSSIPWEAIAPYEGQAKVNHDQSLEKLAGRGGLDPVEAFFIMTGRSWHEVRMSDELEKEACAFLDKIVRDRQELRADVEQLKFALGNSEDWASLKQLERDTALKERDVALLQKDELRKALHDLVHEVEDTWHHHGRCMIGTDEQKPETECECGPDLDEALELLCRIRPGTENQNGVKPLTPKSTPYDTSGSRGEPETPA